MVLLAGVAFTTVASQHGRASRRADVLVRATTQSRPIGSIHQDAPTTRGDIAINIINTMNHPWDVFYLQGETRVPVGHVEGGGTTAVAVPDVASDSVTLVVVSDAMGVLARTFPTHSATSLVWQL